MDKTRIRKMTTELFRFSILICLLLVLSGCDNGIYIKGKVYAKKSTDGESEAFVDEAHPVDSDLILLEGATVTLFGHNDFSKRLPDKSKDENETRITKKDGSFVIGHLTEPFRFQAAMIVEKEGYKPVTKTFKHGKSDHEAIIILVPMEKANAQKKD